MISRRRDFQEISSGSALPIVVGGPLMVLYQKELAMLERSYAKAVLVLVILLMIPATVLATETSNPAAETQGQDRTEPAAPADRQIDQEPAELPGANELEQPQDPQLGETSLPEARNVLTCSEYCGQGVYVSCSCSGSGTCSSQSGWSGWVECLCNEGSDDEEVCPGYGGGGCSPPPTTCKHGIPCSSGSCTCGTGTCINGYCNCEA